ncbi:hypothetical protein Vretimale_3745 [Volvox reticuliferus]|nr:hypothetical protein Vretimale_3745 [Volvox reticuliferus]
MGLGASGLLPAVQGAGLPGAAGPMAPVGQQPGLPPAPLLSYTPHPLLLQQQYLAGQLAAATVQGHANAAAAYLSGLGVGLRALQPSTTQGLAVLAGFGGLSLCPSGSAGLLSDQSPRPSSDAAASGGQTAGATAAMHPPGSQGAAGPARGAALQQQPSQLDGGGGGSSGAATRPRDPRLSGGGPRTSADGDGGGGGIFKHPSNPLLGSGDGAAPGISKGFGRNDCAGGTGACTIRDVGTAGCLPESGTVGDKGLDKAGTVGGGKRSIGDLYGNHAAATAAGAVVQRVGPGATRHKSSRRRHHRGHSPQRSVGSGASSSGFHGGGDKSGGEEANHCPRPSREYGSKDGIGQGGSLAADQQDTATSSGKDEEGAAGGAASGGGATAAAGAIGMMPPSKHAKLAHEPQGKLQMHGGSGGAAAPGAAPLGRPAHLAPTEATPSSGGGSGGSGGGSIGGNKSGTSNDAYDGSMNASDEGSNEPGTAPADGPMGQPLAPSDGEGRLGGGRDGDGLNVQGVAVAGGGMPGGAARSFSVAQPNPPSFGQTATVAQGHALAEHPGSVAIATGISHKRQRAELLPETPAAA